MDKINALRSIDGRVAVFLRFGNAGHLIIGIQGTEREIERAAWFDLPLDTTSAARTDLDRRLKSPPRKRALRPSAMRSTKASQRPLLTMAKNKWRAADKEDKPAA